MVWSIGCVRSTAWYLVLVLVLNMFNSKYIQRVECWLNVVCLVGRRKTTSVGAVVECNSGGGHGLRNRTKD